MRDVAKDDDKYFVSVNNDLQRPWEQPVTSDCGKINRPPKIENFDKQMDPQSKSRLIALTSVFKTHQMI